MTPHHISETIWTTGTLTLSLIWQFCSRRLWTYFVKSGKSLYNWMDNLWLKVKSFKKRHSICSFFILLLSCILSKRAKFPSLISNHESGRKFWRRFKGLIQCLSHGQQLTIYLSYKVNTMGLTHACMCLNLVRGFAYINHISSNLLNRNGY